ncbi:MAG: hypothetical protein ACFE75_01155 [Candidatus Hodarchaeota archaeon]
MDIFIEKLNMIIPGRLFGLFSIIVGVLGDIIALLMYPIMEYDFMRNAVSTLCLGPGGIFFNVGNILSGLFALIFVNYLGRTFNEEQINKKLKKSSIICANISCISFFFLGVFCGSNLIIAYIHGTSAIISWGFGLCYITIYNLLILRDSNYSNLLAYFGFFVSLSLSLLMLIFLLHIFPVLRFLMTVLPLLEWINTIAVIFWYLIIAIYMIHKKI